MADGTVPCGKWKKEPKKGNVEDLIEEVRGLPPKFISSNPEKNSNVRGKTGRKGEGVSKYCLTGEENGCLCGALDCNSDAGHD